MAVIEGTMGLKGIWATVANSTAMVCFVAFAFMMFYAAQSMHVEAIGMLEKNQQEQNATWREQHNALRVVLDKNSMALERLADEIRASRFEPRSKP